MKKVKDRTFFITVCVAPALILFIIFMLIPTFNVFKMSLYKWGGYSNNKQFVGLNNFKILMEDENFFRSFQNTVLLIVCVTIVTMALSLIFAGILSREKIKGQNFFRVIFYIPNILSVVVISAIFPQFTTQTMDCSTVLLVFSGAPKKHRFCGWAIRSW